MFTIIYRNFLLIIFHREMKENVYLVYLSIYRNFRKLKKDQIRKLKKDQIRKLKKDQIRKLKKDQNRHARSEMAIGLTMKLSDESQLLRLINEGEDGEDKGIAKELLEDDSVVDALVRMFTVQKVIYQSSADSSDKKVVVLDEAIRALDASPLAESLKYLSPLNKDTSKRLKSVLKELKADHALFAWMFPKKISLKDLTRLFGIFTGVYFFGSYVFTFIVFEALQSSVVSLKHSDYLQFATTHNFWAVPLLLFLTWFIPLGRHHRNQEFYLPAELGAPFKRYEKMEIIACWFIVFAFIVDVNTPVFKKLLDIEIEGWMGIVFVDLFLLLTPIVIWFPYRRVFYEWYVLRFTLLLALMLVFHMGSTGLRLAEELKESSSRNWHYLFDDIKVTSDDYSFVYEGDSSVVFYERDSGKFFVKDKKAMKSFLGNL